MKMRTTIDVVSWYPQTRSRRQQRETLTGKNRVPRDGINLKKNFCPCQAHIIPA